MKRTTILSKATQKRLPKTKSSRRPAASERREERKDSENHSDPNFKSNRGYFWGVKLVQLGCGNHHLNNGTRLLWKEPNQR
jgi:hypothetical protein